MANTHDIYGSAWIMNETVGLIDWKSYEENIEDLDELSEQEAQGVLDNPTPEVCYKYQNNYYFYYEFSEGGFGMWYTTPDLNTRTPIVKSSLVQEVITFIEGSSDCKSENKVIIPNIWENLSGTVSNTPFDGSDPDNPNNYHYHVQSPIMTSEIVDAAKTLYFYWEYKETSMDDDTTWVHSKFTCPNPREGLIIPPYEYSDIDGASHPYLRFWTRKYKEGTENYEKAAVIQRKEVKFAGTEWVNQYGLGPNVEDGGEDIPLAWNDYVLQPGDSPIQDPNFDPTTTPVVDGDIYQYGSKYYKGGPASKYSFTPDYTFHNNDLGDITNLLSLF